MDYIILKFVTSGERNMTVDQMGMIANLLLYMGTSKRDFQIFPLCLIKKTTHVKAG